jgi:hypothetical protein
MFDASDKFNVEIKNRGTEPIIIRAQEAAGAREARIRRVCGKPAPEIVQPGQSIMLIGYEPGVSHKIEPGLRSPDHPMGMLDAVPVEFGKPGVVEHVQQGLPPMPWTGEPEKEKPTDG